MTTNPPTSPTVEKWENIDGLMKEVDSQLVRTPAGNVSVIDEMIPCDVMARVKYFLYKAYDLGKAQSVQEAKADRDEYWSKMIRKITKEYPIGKPYFQWLLLEIESRIFKSKSTLNTKEKK